MGLKTEATGNQYIDNKPQQIEVNGSDAQINSVFTVEQQSEVTPAPEAATVQNSENSSSTTETFYGYNIDDLRKYLQKGNNDNSTIQQLIEEAENKLAEEMNFLDKMLNNEDYKHNFIFTKEQQEIFDKLFPGKDGLKKAIIAAYFNVGEVYVAIEHIEGKLKEGFELDSAEMQEYYNMRIYKCCIYDEIDQDENNQDETKVLYDTIKALEEATTPESKRNILDHYIMCRVMFEYDDDETQLQNLKMALSEIINETQDSEIKQMIFEIIKGIFDDKSVLERKNEDQIKRLENFQAGLIEAFIGTYKDFNEKCEIIDKIANSNVFYENKELFRYILEKLTNTDSVIYNNLSDDNKKLINQWLSGENLSDEDEVAVKEIIGKLYSAFQNLMAAGGVHEANGDLTPEDAGKLGQLTGVITGILNEEEQHDFWSGVHNIIEQHPDWFQGVDQDQFNEIMNRISNGNYSIVVEDILRGDGVHSPLNMSAPDGNVPQGDGASIPEGGYDQSSGGYYVDPSVNYEAQSAYVFSLQQNIYMSSNQSPLPQRVVENTPAAEAQTVSSNPSFIKTREEGKEYLKNNINGVKNFLTGKIDGIGVFADMAIEKYKSFGREQAEYFADAKDKFNSILEPITKVNSIRSFFAAGGKGNSVAKTRFMQEMLDEDKEKKKKEAC